MVEHKKGYTGALTVAEQESGALHVEHVHTYADDILLESDDEDVGDEEVEELLKMRMTIDAGSAMVRSSVFVLLTNSSVEFNHLKKIFIHNSPRKPRHAKRKKKETG